MKMIKNVPTKKKVDIVSPPEFLGRKLERPKGMLVAYRMKNEYEEISEKMKAYGIKTRLENEREATKTANDYGTNPYGWNHLPEELES